VTAFTSKNGLTADFVGSMIVDRNGGLWMGHPGGFPAGQGGGATHFDGKSFKPFTKAEGLNITDVYCMLEDSAGRIWFGSAGSGACRYDGKVFVDFSAVPSAGK
jgi:ligand-binding sensor domain-containing protein